MEGVKATLGISQPTARREMRERLCKRVEFALMRERGRFVVPRVYRFIPFERKERLHALAKLRRASAGEIGAADALAKEGVAGKQGFAA